MADNTVNNDNLNNDVDADGKEPATGHDVGIGGGLGVVGGAIVGGLAGGPVGAIIGAVAGGIVSAGAVDVVDKHDHDYARTVSNDTVTEDATTRSADYTGTDTLAPGRTSEYTGPGDYARTRNVAGTEDLTATEDVANTARTTADYDTSRTGQNFGTGADQTVELHAERLDAQKEQVQTGEVTLRKEVITENQSIDVPVTREEVVIERHAVSGDQAATGVNMDREADQVIRVPVMEERVTVEKTPVVTEEVSLGKRQVTETQHVQDTVRREELEIDNPQNVDVLDRSRAGGTGSNAVLNDMNANELDEDDLDSDINVARNNSTAR